MVPRLAWRNLIPGIIATAVLVGITAAVLVSGGIGRIPGDKINLHVVTTSARGVMQGTQVWVSGQQVGTVESISFRSVTADSARVVIGVRVREDDADQIRRDSEIRVQSGTSLIAPLVVYIIPGTPGSPRVRDGDTLFARAQNDVAATAARFGEATKQMGPIMADARIIMAQARDPDGTVGALLASGTSTRVSQLRAQVSRLRAQVMSQNGRGSAARSRLMASAQSAMAQVDSVRALLASGETSLGRFRRDSTLGTTVASVRDRLATLRAQIDSSEGTFGRFQNDSSVTRAITDARREMALLFEDIQKRPLRYIAF